MKDYLRDNKIISMRGGQQAKTNPRFYQTTYQILQNNDLNPIWPLDVAQENTSPAKKRLKASKKKQNRKKNSN